MGYQYSTWKEKGAQLRAGDKKSNKVQINSKSECKEEKPDDYRLRRTWERKGIF